ncbi:MAG: hypothetical protein MUP27_08950 [Desulfobacterales bacterium]|nr:hypothetical protein [Desulfobacterales bacterium]
MSNEEGISVCLYCYQAVIKLKFGVSDWIYKARCVECGRVFILDLSKKKKEGESYGRGKG